MSSTETRKGLRHVPEVAAQVAAAKRKMEVTAEKAAQHRLDKEINTKKSILEKAILMKGSDYSSTMAKKIKGD